MSAIAGSPYLPTIFAGVVLLSLTVFATWPTVWAFVGGLWLARLEFTA